MVYYKKEQSVAIACVMSPISDMQILFWKRASIKEK